MSKNNQKAWKEIRETAERESWHIGAGVQRDNYSGTKSRFFLGIFDRDNKPAFPGSVGRSAYTTDDDSQKWRDTYAQARALHKKFGIPLDNNIPAEPYKRHSSITIGKAQSEVLFKMAQHEAEAEASERSEWIPILIVNLLVIAALWMLFQNWLALVIGWLVFRWIWHRIEQW